MILRFYGPDGQFRLELEPTDEFPSIIEKLKAKVPDNTDHDSFAISNQRNGGDSRLLTKLKGVTFKRVGLK
jgi:nuclear protein localization protein 4 homolog